MPSFYTIALRHSRRFSTAASTVAAASTAAKPLNLSQTKYRLEKAQDPDEALKIYNSFIAGNHPSTAATKVVYLQDYVVRLLAKSRRFSDIETLLESLKSSSHVTGEKLFSALIRSYGSAGMFENALKTYEQMDEFGMPRSTLSFNAILWAFSHSSLYDRVITYFDEFPAKFGFSPDNYSYGILIKAHCEMGSHEIAIEKLNEMQGKGFELNSVVCTTIYQSLYTNGMIEEAESFWDEVVNEKGLKPDISLYNVKLKSIQHGDTDGFSRIIEEMNSAGIMYNGVTYNKIIKFYCENGMMKEANETYDKMLTQKGLDRAPVSAAFRTLVIHSYNIGQVMLAYKVFKKSLHYSKTLDFDTLEFLAKGLVKMGLGKEAESLIVRSMKKTPPPNLLEACGQLANDLGLVLGRNEDLDLEKTENGVEYRGTVKPSESPKAMDVKPRTSSQTQKLINVFS